jgi:hypothetical protein
MDVHWHLWRGGLREERAAELHTFITDEEIRARAARAAVIRRRTLDEALDGALSLATKGTLSVAFVSILS